MDLDAYVTRLHDAAEREAMEGAHAEAEREAALPYLVCCCGEPASSVNEVLLCSHETKGVR